MNTPTSIFSNLGSRNGPPEAIFSVLQKTVKKRMVRKPTVSANFGNFWASDVDFQQFLVPKQVPGGYFFGVFLKTVILSKSCSRCGGSTIFKGQTLQKSVPRPTPNDNGARKHKKSIPAPSPDPLFRPRDRFWWTFRLLPGPKNTKKQQFSCLRLAPGAQLFAGLVQNACRRPSERQK